MKINSKKQLVFLIALLLGFSSIFAQKTAVKQTSGINTSLIDLSVKPSQDFYRHANGTWIKKTAIPANVKSWNVFGELSKNANKDALNILKQAVKNQKYKSNTAQGKVVNLYKTIMDTVGRNKRGLSPLKPYLAKINSIKDVKDLQVFLEEMEPISGIGFFDITIGVDARNRNKNAIYLVLGRNGLPARDYYVSNTDKNEDIRNKYLLHLSRMLQFLGENPAQAQFDALKILELETAMAKPRLTSPENQLLSYTYNPMKVSDLQNLTPSIDWNAYFSHLGLKNVDSLIVQEPKYMMALETIFKEYKVEDWKAYLRYALLRKSAERLSTKVEKAHWEFYGKTLNNETKQKPRDERALGAINEKMGQALGQLYAEKKFPLESKVKVEKMVKYLVAAFQNRINNLTWISAETKLKAIDKLNKITFKIGYPDKWRDYSTLTIKSPEQGGSFFENMQNTNRFIAKEVIGNLYKPFDKPYHFLPHQVFVHFNRFDKVIIVPASMVQSPFFNPQADDAVNFGGIGAIIAREISRELDENSRYNIDGDLDDWWTADDLKQFTPLSGKLVDQYSAIEPLPGIHIDGKTTLNENIADFAGINVAYDALQLFLNENGRPRLIDGFTPEQRFFIAWATIWRAKIQDEELKIRLKRYPISPEMYRTNVPLQNMDVFYEAFTIKPGDGMYIAPENRVKIW
jgi:putative endopeptidase